MLSFPIFELKKILYYHHTYNKYLELQKEVSVLKAHLVGLEEVVRENARLEKLLEYRRSSPYSHVAASVIGREPSQWNASIVINKGEEQGIGQGMAVVNLTGVIGKIAEVSRYTSKVILITDPQFSVAGLIQRSRANGLISGTLQGTCRMKYLDVTSGILKGDKVITSKLSSTFPEGLLIGEIEEVDFNPTHSALEAIVRPAVSFNELEEVLVIIK